MAKSGPKRQLQENRSRLAFLRNLLLSTNVTFLLGRLLVFRANNTATLYATGVGMSAVQAFCYTAVSRMADISFASIASYYQDVIYLCSFVQVFCIYTDKAFWAFWLLPLVAGWIVYNSVIKPLMAHSASTKEVAETEVERKRREKAEKKANRPKIRNVR